MADIPAAIQAMLDEAGDGWQLAEHLVIMALERVGPDGIESTVWYWSPNGASWKDAGLLEAAARLMDDADTAID